MRPQIRCDFLSQTETQIAWFLLAYHVVLGVKGARADPRVLRQTLDALRCDVAFAVTGQFRPDGDRT